MKVLQSRCPFRWQGIASDNGSEFINHHLIRFCEEQKISFSRTRAGRKNDNPYVEQKNYLVVRRAVGYGRYEGEEDLERVNHLYEVLRLQINFFKPVMKLASKERSGSRIRKRYEVPKTPYQRVGSASTPYQRVCESPQISAKRKAKLRQQYARLNPAELAREIGRLQEQLLFQLSPEETEQWKGYGLI